MSSNRGSDSSGMLVPAIRTAGVVLEFVLGVIDGLTDLIGITLAELFITLDALET